MSFEEYKQKVYDTTIKLDHYGLIRLSSGNVSMRINELLVAITPTNRPYDIMKPEDISIITLDGTLVEGRFNPSSETPLHTTLYRKMPSVNAIIHTHSVYCMTFAVTNKRLPIFSIEALAANDDDCVPVARYVSPGSPKAGEVAYEVFKEKPNLKALLLKNHGLLAVGSDIGTTWETAYKIETAAQVAYQAYMIGTPIALTSEQLHEIREIYHL